MRAGIQAVVLCMLVCSSMALHLGLNILYVHIDDGSNPVDFTTSASNLEEAINQVEYFTLTFNSMTVTSDEAFMDPIDPAIDGIILCDPFYTQPYSYNYDASVNLEEFIDLGKFVILVGDNLFSEEEFSYLFFAGGNQLINYFDPDYVTSFSAFSPSRYCVPLTRGLFGDLRGINPSDLNPTQADSLKSMNLQGLYQGFGATPCLHAYPGRGGLMSIRHTAGRGQWIYLSTSTSSGDDSLSIFLSGFYNTILNNICYYHNQVRVGNIQQIAQLEFSMQTLEGGPFMNSVYAHDFVPIMFELPWDNPYPVFTRSPDTLAVAFDFSMFDGAPFDDVRVQQTLFDYANQGGIVLIAGGESTLGTNTAIQSFLGITGFNSYSAMDTSFTTGNAAVCDPLLAGVYGNFMSRTGLDADNLPFSNAILGSATACAVRTPGTLASEGSITMNRIGSNGGMAVFINIESTDGSDWWTYDLIFNAMNNLFAHRSFATIGGDPHIEMSGDHSRLDLPFQAGSMYHLFSNDQIKVNVFINSGMGKEFIQRAGILLGERERFTADLKQAHQQPRFALNGKSLDIGDVMDTSAGTLYVTEPEPNLKGEMASFSRYLTIQARIPNVFTIVGGYYHNHAGSGFGFFNIEVHGSNEGAQGILAAVESRARVEFQLENFLVESMF